MTRLQAFAATLTREMLEAFWAPDAKRGWDSPEARAVAEARIREFVQDAMWAARSPHRTGWRDAFAYLDEPDD